MEDNADADGVLAVADEDASPAQHLQTGLTPRLKELLQDRCTSGVYVLILENGKYYVGSAEDMERRIEKHKAKTCVVAV